MATEGLHGVRRDISRREITQDGRTFIEIVYELDYGPKLGTTRVRVLDPCVSQEAQQKRREAMVHKCQELIRRGLM